PLDAKTQVGPLATLQIAEELDAQVQRTVQMGARVLTGGKRREGPGSFYLPTVLVDVPASSPAAREELFGPVAPIFRAVDLDAAIRLANDTPFGLGASVWTQDPKEEERLIRDVQAGSVFVNQMVASDPRLPFGGIKLSGYGRELGALGMRE